MWVLFVHLFPTIGLLALLGGLAHGRGRVLLLKYGEPAEATLTKCRSNVGKNNHDQPIADFKRQWHANMEAAQRLLSAVVVLPLAIRSFGALWACGVVAFTVFDVVFCLFGILSLLFNFPIPFNAPADVQLMGTLIILGFLIISLTMVYFMLRISPAGALGRMASLPWKGFDPEQAAGLQKTIPNADCAFTFKLPDGQEVEARDTDYPGRRSGRRSPSNRRV